MSDRLVTRAIHDALRRRYCAPEWALFTEVHRTTGGGCRSADAVAMNMFPSRGLRVHAVEVKASRSDWLRELKNPHKAEDIQQFCDHWWVAAVPDVVKDGELPPTWGLLTLHGNTLRQTKAAPLLDAKPMDRRFIAALLRRASERAATELREAVDKAMADERAAIDDRIKRAVEMRRYEHGQLAESVAKFEAASGIKLDSPWASGNIGRDVAIVQKLNLTGWSGVAQLAKMARTFADAADEHLPKVGSDDDG